MYSLLMMAMYRTFWLIAAVTLTLLALSARTSASGSSVDVDGSSSSNISKVYVVFSNHLDIGYTMNINGSTSAAVSLGSYVLPTKKALELQIQQQDIPG